MNWVEKLLTKIDYRSVYPKGKTVGANQISVHCPFHDDKHESLSINLVSGMYFCHACSERGNFLTWAQSQNISLKDLAESYGISTEQKTIDYKEVDKFHKELISDKKLCEWLERKRGFSLDTIKRFKLGTHKKHFTIPVLDLSSDLVNIRMYNPIAKDSAKVLSWKAGFGGNRLFPIENIYKEQIMICEGETDCMLANQLGYSAVTSTAGSNSFPNEWAKYFSGKEVTICFDIDDAGKKGAQRVSKLLTSLASSVKIINLPMDLKEFPKGDLTDFIVEMGKTKKDVDKIIKETESLLISVKKEEAFYEDVPLDKADHSRYNKKFIQTSALISGKDLETYIVPKKVHVTCTMSMGHKVCPYCPVSFEDGDVTIDIENTNENLLSLCNVTKAEKGKLIKDVLNIPFKCNIVNIDELDSYNIENIILTTNIEYTTSIEKDQSFVTRPAHYIGHAIEANKSYEFKGKTIAHPKTQAATHIIFEATPSTTAIDNFKFTDDISESLNKFQTKDIRGKLKDMYDSTIQYVSGLKGREDLFITTLMTFCSPLGFYFEDKLLNKGYIESLILGDTRTGKTEMLKCLIEYFRLGELVLGESASFAGLVGGLQQIGSRWNLTWGRIPLNNKRLVAIDEMSGLSIWEIAKLSGIRSSGIAEITKIRTEKTWARTRLIWMSNPRGTREETKKMLSSYSQGVRAVSELIGKSEDISRFDLVLMLGVDDVSIDIINAPSKTPKKMKYSSDDFHNLIMFAWTLPPEDIKFSKKALDAIYSNSKDLARKYDETIPLVLPSAQRIKLAKLAVAFAVITFNYDNKKLIVEPEHVNFATEFLNEIFDKPICAYNEYSRLEKARHRIINEEAVKELISQDESIIDQLLDIDRFNHSDLQEIFNANSRNDIKKIINVLVQNKAIKRTQGSGYEKTSAFINFLRTHKNGYLSMLDAPEPDEKKKSIKEQAEDRANEVVSKEFDGETFEETEDLPF